MNISVSYCTLEQIINLNLNFSMHRCKLKKTFTYNDIYIVYLKDNSVDLICSDIDFIDSLYYILVHHPNLGFTQSLRCCIISQEELCQIIDYNEFISRYGLKL